VKKRPPLSHLEEALGVKVEETLLELALTHRSYAYENGGIPTNERLEFLGDAVLGVVVTDALFRDHPELAEGRLAKLRASVVNSRALASVSRTLSPYGLGAYLLLGKGEEGTGGREKDSILADALEAVLGAIYIEHGIETATSVILKLFEPLMSESARKGVGLDWKTSLQELTAMNSWGVPEYEVTEEGPDHAKAFTAWAVVGGERFGGSRGRTKKEAEQRSAEEAFLVLSNRAVDETHPEAEASDAGAA
jgi:ribonuclease-3